MKLPAMPHPTLPASRPRTVSIQFHVVEVIIMIGKEIKKEVDLTQDGSPQLQGMDPYYPPPLPWFRDVSFCTCHGLNDHHASESDADGAVVASGIVARLQITHQLLNGHRTSTHNRHKLNQWLCSLDGGTLTRMEGGTIL